jgi:hypothetical protein
VTSLVTPEPNFSMDSPAADAAELDRDSKRSCKNRKRDGSEAMRHVCLPPGWLELNESLRRRRK